MNKDIMPISDGVRLRGFFRIQIENPKTGKIVGDSGWKPNEIVNEGFDDFLCRLVANTTDSKQVNRMSLGTGTVPNVTHTQLDGEIMGSTKKATVAVSVSASKTVEFQATFNSSDRSVAYTIKNVGLCDTAGTGGVLMAGNTFATSQAQTNQNVNASYQLQFSTS